ncbi:MULTISPECIES: YccS family putative transporter [unclassified Dyella]|uniref:YccS family putative transporter n=1 Tax=unclassified Dyella TaxID=2634549 RepID=UPI000C819230|nr:MULTISPECIES: YccS family putative transporter [unclassified Dyella]MDR3448016.1 YccS family putative transporter [Dyella sp.]PMQ05467.1 Inner membrane protein YccS [Dyella sp. AD56]
MLNSLTLRWRRLRGSDRYAECLRVLLALGGAVAWCFGTGHAEEVVSILLGVIACALAETEDHWRNRLTTLLLTLTCFAISAFAVQWLFPYPLLFAVGLPLSTFALVMLGAASERYATVAGATLLLAVYTMICADQARIGPWWYQPSLLLAGAAWYGVLSLLWSLLAPQQAVRLSLARLFDALADYLEGKAALFTPVHGVDREAMQWSQAMQNERVVEAMNDTRLMLVDRIGARRPRGQTAERLQLYFLAQDIHERISSAHYPYDALAESLFHSDVLFRCEHLLRLEAGTCRQRADAMRLRTHPRTNADSEASVRDLQDALIALREQAHPPAAHLLRSVDALVRNLTAIQQRLANDTSEELPTNKRERVLQDPAPQSLGDAWDRIRMQLTPRSFRFRHAIRLALALLVGYAVLHAVHPKHGYWILLTTLLVCQPSYGATRLRLAQRVAGTVAGLVLGWATLQLVPFGPWQMLLIVVSGVTFFAARLRRYATATTAITLFVVLCFNQVGSGYDAMLPRLLDTLIGTAIAALAMRWVLPDWQGRRFDDVLADMVRTDARYLEQIIRQYASGRRDDLDYRIARRDAHNASAALSAVLANMLREPGQHQRGTETLLRFLSAAHLLLGQLSALGVNRAAIASPTASEAVTKAGKTTADALAQLGDALANGLAAQDSTDDTALLEPLAAHIDDETARLVLGQLMQILVQRDRLAELANTLNPA